MKTKICFLLFLLLGLRLIFGQDAPESVTKDYIAIAEYANNANYEKAEKEYSKMLDVCKKEKYFNLASLSCNSLGKIYQSKGNFEKARQMFEEGIVFGKKSNLKSGLAMNMGSLDWMQSLLGAPQNNARNIRAGIALLEDNTYSNDIFREFILGDLYSILLNSDSSYNVKLSYAQKALEYYKKIPDKYFIKSIRYSVAYINIAMIQENAGNVDPAIHNLEQANKYNQLYPIKRTSVRVFLGLMLCYDKKKNYDSVITYGNKFIEFSNGADQPELSEVYKTLINAYKQTGQSKMAQKYFDEYEKLENKLNKNKLKTVLKINEANEKENVQKSEIIKLLFYVLIFILVILLGVISYLRYNNRKNTKIFNEFRKSLLKDEKKEIQNINHTPAMEEEAHGLVISKETINQILQGLDDFEENESFREIGLTQGKLATQLQTNTRYLSMIIKDYKSENFSSYITRLRINYVVKKLEMEPQYRKYKISYLAEEAGYPTASSFTKSFKEIVGITPSTYIGLLDEDLVVKSE